MHVLHKKLSVNEQEQLYPLIPLPIINIEIVTKIIEKYDSINVCYCFKVFRHKNITWKPV